MNIQFGISTGFTIKRWTQPSEWVRLVKEDLRLDVVQFSFDQLDPRSSNDFIHKYCELVRNECKKYEVKIHSTFTGLSIYSHNLLYHPLKEGRLDGVDWFEKAFAITEKLGCNATGGPIGGMDVATFLSESERNISKRNAEQSLIQLLQTAEKYGIEHFYWEATPVEREGVITIDETRAFIEKINKIAGNNAATFSLCFDVGHSTNPTLSNEEKNPFTWIKSLHDHIPVIHLQQSDGYLDRHWPFTEKYNQKGNINPIDLLEAIKKTGKEEIVLLLEIGHPFEEDDQIVLKEIKESVAFWKEELGKKVFL